MLIAATRRSNLGKLLNTTGLLDYWNIFRCEITFVTFSASQYIFFVSTDSALS